MMIKFQSTLTPRQKLFILVWDFIVIGISLSISYFFRIGELSDELFQASAFWIIPFVLTAFYYIFGAYDLDGKIKLKDLYIRTSFGSALGFLSIIGLNYFLAKERMGIFGRGVLVPALVIHYSLSVVYRTGIWAWFHAKSGEMEWLILATKSSIDLLLKEATKYSWRGKYSFLVPENESGQSEGKVADLNFKILGSWNELDQNISKNWSGLMVAAPWRDLPAGLCQSLMSARLSGQSVVEISEFFESNFRKIPVDFLGPEWFIFEKGFDLLHNPLGLRIKRLFDLAFALILLFITWPLMLLTALAVRLESSGPALYRQVRSGQSGRNFTILKFRSMGMNAEAGGAQWALVKDPRITKVGKFIRLTRLDELPQLFNVLKGEMSFVGPRPERPEFNLELETKIPFYSLRYLVRPGLTGWAQINYPYGASVEDAKEKLQHDLFYIKNHSIALDIQVVLKTIKVVLFGQGR
ncbi:MAG: sugar transferase [Bdellovibrionota bacterium]